MKLRVLLLSVLVSFVTVGKASASLIFDFTEVGGNVEMTMSGSIDLDATLGLTGTSFNTLQAIIPNNAFNGMGNVLAGDAVPSEYYDVDQPWIPFGSSSSVTLFTVSSGDRVALFSGDGFLALPVGYVSGTPLSATGTVLGASFASLGMTPGSYVTTFSNEGVFDSVTVNVGATSAPVPEPATLSLLGLGLAGAAVRRFKKRR